MTQDDIDFTQAWWSNKLSDPEALLTFLTKLYFTEFSGYADNLEAADKYAVADPVAHNIFCQTAADEMRHASLIVPLVLARGGSCCGSEPSEPSFYWTEMDKIVVDLKSCAAVFHLGERLAAERFEVMLDMPATPSDIRGFLEEALPDEQHHARIFGKLAGPEAVAAAQAHHDATTLALKDLQGLRRASTLGAA